MIWRYPHFRKPPLVDYWCCSYENLFFGAGTSQLAMFEPPVAFECFKWEWRTGWQKKLWPGWYCMDNPPFTMAHTDTYIWIHMAKSCISPYRSNYLKWQVPAACIIQTNIKASWSWIPDDSPTLPGRNAKRGKQQPSSLLLISLLPWAVFRLRFSDSVLSISKCQPRRNKGTHTQTKRCQLLGDGFCP